MQLRRAANQGLVRGGGYAFHINQGSYNDAKLDGLTIGFFIHSPAAIHLGNVTGYVLIDEKANDAQRAAIGHILGGTLGGPFAVFAGVLVKVIGPDFVPVEWKFDGANSYAKFGDRAEQRLAAIKNPVTGEASGFNLKMSAGLLTDESDLMTSSKFFVKHADLSYDHSGQYGETFRFNYAGEG